MMTCDHEDCCRPVGRSGGLCAPCQLGFPPLTRLVRSDRDPSAGDEIVMLERLFNAPPAERGWPEDWPT